MKIEFILIGVIMIIFIIDFFRKKNIKPTKEIVTIKSNVKSPNWVLSRKKNITLSIVTIPILKAVFHYLLYPIKTKRLTGKVPVPENGRFRTRTRSRFSNTYEEVTASFGEHIKSSESGDLIIFTEQILLYIPAILFFLIIVWFFNDKIKAR
jgi:hypothetical protein